MNDERLTEKSLESEKLCKKHSIRKVIIIIISIFLLVIIATMSLFYIYTLNIQKEVVSKNTQAIICDEKIFEYGTHLTYSDILENLIADNELIDGTNVKIYIGETLLTEDIDYVFNTLSDITVNIETSTKIMPLLDSIPFFNQEIIVNKQVVWKVQDTKLPVLSGVKDIAITQGDTLDIKSDISAMDEVDGDLDVIIEGEFDTNTVGEYTLIAKAIDKNNNESKQEFKVIVNAKPENQVQDNVSSNSNKNSTSSSKTSTNSSNKNSSTKTNSNTNTNSNSNSSNNTSTDPASTKEGRLSLAKAEAKRVVSRIIKPSMTKLEKAKAICNYITTTVDVQTNQSSEAYKTNYGNEAYAALVLKISACSGRCKAVTLLCDAAGLKSQHINANQWSHQWNKIQIDDGSWVVVDAQIGFVGERHPLE